MIFMGVTAILLFFVKGLCSLPLFVMMPGRVWEVHSWLPFSVGAFEVVGILAFLHPQVEENFVRSKISRIPLKARKFIIVLIVISAALLIVMAFLVLPMLLMVLDSLGRTTSQARG